MKRIIYITIIICIFFSCSKKSKVEVGDRAFSFSLPGLKEKIIDFKLDDGKVKILYFWADWCPRCREDFEQLEKFYKKWKKAPDGPELITVNVGQSIEHVKHFVKILHVTFPVALDKNGEIAKKYNVTGLPTYFIIDKKGIIRYIILGWAEEKVLKDYLKRVSH